MAGETGSINPNTLQHWNYKAESRPALTDNAPQVDISTTSWFNGLAHQFNRGDSMPSTHSNLRNPGDVAENYLSSLIASTLMHLVSEEAERGEIGIATRFERHILESWADNRLRFYEGGESNLRTKFWEFAETMALEKLLTQALKKGLNAIGNKALPNMETTVLETIAATLTSKKTIDLAHLNTVAFESCVAINATAVDPYELYSVMHKTMNIALIRQSQQAAPQK